MKNGAWNEEGDGQDANENCKHLESKDMFLQISNLSVQYAGRPTPAVDGVTFTLQAGEIGVLIGPSGCGKTTLLRAVAGLERAHSGSITLGPQIISSSNVHIPAEQRHWGHPFPK